MILAMDTANKKKRLLKKIILASSFIAVIILMTGFLIPAITSDGTERFTDTELKVAREALELIPKIEPTASFMPSKLRIESVELFTEGCDFLTSEVKNDPSHIAHYMIKVRSIGFFGNGTAVEYLGCNLASFK